MDWYGFIRRTEDMHATQSDAELLSAWKQLVAAVDEQDFPYHLALCIKEFDRLRGTRPRSEFRILDHGCGPATALIWLAAIGFTNIRGVDVGGDFVAQNRWARIALGYDEDRFAIYDGTTLPVTDNSIDAIISHQVLEHVPEAQYRAYYSEQGRVLVDGGIVQAQVPHRLVPYDSHTDTWVLHMLPEKTARSLMPLFKREWPDHLHLRWPWTHRQMSQRFIGPVVNHSAKRLIELQTLAYYDGPQGLRGMIARACATPGVGPAIAALMSNFVLMETIARKVPDQRTANRG